MHRRRAGATPREASAQLVEVGQAPGIEGALEGGGEFGLAAALMGEDERPTRSGRPGARAADDQRVPTRAKAGRGQRASR